MLVNKGAGQASGHEIGIWTEESFGKQIVVGKYKSESDQQYVGERSVSPAS
jgi:hypothetical protein